MIEMTAKNFWECYLVDGPGESGGKAFSQERLCDFLDWDETKKDMPIEEVNEMLIQCGIMPFDTENWRVCDECDKAFQEGFMVEGGLEYYCSDECLHKHYTEEEWLEMCKGDDSQSCWTTWY